MILENVQLKLLLLSAQKNTTRQPNYCERHTKNISIHVIVGCFGLKLHRKMCPTQKKVQNSSKMLHFWANSCGL